jgi:hypothetical protein
MKIRTGFVSNSSSSSFCIIGVTGRWASRLLSAELNEAPPVRPNHGEDCECSKCRAFNARKNGELSDDLNFAYGHFEPEDKKKKMLLEYYGSGGRDVQAAGFPAKEILEDSSLKDARKAFQMAIKKKLDIDVPLSEIGLCHGTAGND